MMNKFNFQPPHAYRHVVEKKKGPSQFKNAVLQVQITFLELEYHRTAFVLSLMIQQKIMDKIL